MKWVNGGRNKMRWQPELTPHGRNLPLSIHPPPPASECGRERGTCNLCFISTRAGAHALLLDETKEEEQREEIAVKRKRGERERESCAKIEDVNDEKDDAGRRLREGGGGCNLQHEIHKERRETRERHRVCRRTALQQDSQGGGMGGRGSDGCHGLPFLHVLIAAYPARPSRSRTRASQRHVMCSRIPLPAHMYQLIRPPTTAVVLAWLRECARVRVYACAT
ncbi:hypothetical protein V8E36_009733 [Tilletia maclaganii]